MSKKKLVKRVTGIALTVGVVILAIVFVGKVNRIQNEKDIIGTWKDVNAEEVFTFQENGELAVSKDMPDSGLFCGNALYNFSYSDIICVTQGDSSVEFEIEVDQNELTIFFMGQEYLGPVKIYAQNCLQAPAE